MDEKKEESTSVNQNLNKKRKWKFLVGGLLFVIALAIGLFIGYNKLNASPYTIYKDTINNIYKKVSNALKESEKKALDIDILNEPINIRVQAKLNTDMEELKAFNDLNYEFSLGMDYKSNKGALNLGIEDDNDPIIKLALLLFNKKIVFKSDELFSKGIDFGEEDAFKDINLDELSKVSYDRETLDIILTKMKTIVINSLDRDKFKMTNEKIKLGDKEKKLKKVTYMLDEENMERTTKYVIEEMKKDDELLEALEKLLGITKEEIKDDLDTNLDNAEYYNLNIVLYVDVLNNVIAASLIEDDFEIAKYEVVDGLFKFSMESDGSDAAKIIVNEEKDGIQVEFDDGEGDNLKLKFGKEDEQGVDFDINTGKFKAKGYLKLNDQKYSKSKYAGNFDFKIETTIDNKDYDIGLTGSISIDNNKVNIDEDEDTVYYEDLNQNQMLEIINNLKKVFDKLNLTDLLDI